MQRCTGQKTFVIKSQEDGFWFYPSIIRCLEQYTNVYMTWRLRGGEDSDHYLNGLYAL